MKLIYFKRNKNKKEFKKENKFFQKLFLKKKSLEKLFD
jgi:hypothetical protein